MIEEKVLDTEMYF